MIKILNRIRMLRVGNRIKKSINSEFIKNKLNEIWKLSHNFRIIGDIIGDCVLYNILFKRNGNKNFFTIFIDDLYKIYLNDNYNEDEKNIKKAEIIGKTISKHLNLSITENNSKKIKKYFLKEYNKHGYVYHSFPSVYFEGISKSGLQAKNGNKSDNSTYNEIEEIQKTFVSHGIYTALGGAGIYGGSGIYYSHKEGQIYPHAIFGPERFSRFTSSDHHTISSGIENIPFAFRNKKKCRENIYTLCKNAGLDNNETKQVVNFFEKNYNKLSKNGSYFALIPKTKVGKIDYKFPKYLGYIPIGKEDSKYTHSEYKELINSIRYTLGDWGNNYKEHIGNVFYANIKPTEMFIIKLPEIGEIIKEKIEFKSETKEHLLDEQKNKETIEKIKTIKKEAPNRIPEWIFNSVNNNKI